MSRQITILHTRVKIESTCFGTVAHVLSTWEAYPPLFWKNTKHWGGSPHVRSQTMNSPSSNYEKSLNTAENYLGALITSFWHFCVRKHFTLRDGSGYQNRWIFGKLPRGEVIFNQKFILQILDLYIGFFGHFPKKIATQFSENLGGGLYDNEMKIENLRNVSTHSAISQ